MINKVIITISAINMALAVSMGYFIPKEMHYFFAFSSREYFLISFVGFCWGLYGHKKHSKLLDQE
tara:strand:- start:54 stop:248 length:195 start_codon:yes stop_codon:yes gene_type:complete